MKFLKYKEKFLAIVLVLFIVSCGAIGIKLTDNAITVLENSAISSVGFLIADNNKSNIPDFEKWYSSFQGASSLTDVQQLFKDGQSKLAALISDKPFLQLQIKNAMNLMELSVDGPTIEADIGKYKNVVDSFMLGVLEAKRA